MDIETVRSFLAWSTVFNFVLLLLWWLIFSSARGWIRRVHGKWFDLSDQTFDALHYGSMGLFKLLIIAFNLVPYLVLCLCF